MVCTLGYQIGASCTPLPCKKVPHSLDLELDFSTQTSMRMPVYEDNYQSKI